MYSKYTKSSDIMKTVEGFDIYNSLKILQLDNIKDDTKVVISENVGRLDLLVKDKYNNYDNYGLIGLLNRIMDPSELDLGAEIRMPSIDNIRNIEGNIYD